MQTSKMFRIASIVLCMACLGLIFSTGCGSLSQGRMGRPFGSAAEEEAFEQAVAADSFPRADQAMLRDMINR